MGTISERFEIRIEMVSIGVLPQSQLADDSLYGGLEYQRKKANFLTIHVVNIVELLRSVFDHSLQYALALDARFSPRIVSVQS